MAPQDWEDWLRLLATDGVGCGTARRLLAAFGPPGQVLAQPQDELARVAGAALAQRLRQVPANWEALRRQTAAWLAQPGHHLIALGEPAYPAALLATPDPPVLLHVVGEPAALAAPRALAIVGSRHATPQGLANAQAFAAALAQRGVAIVSGLAAGIDGAAHEGALQAGGITVAVVGTGADRVYPARHQALARRLVEAGGAIVSEYLLGTPPRASNFPRRNRLIAGLAHGTLVVEAALDSGSLITAELAAQMGREVFAIPGSIHAPQSRGCHALIRQGAKLVETVEHIEEELRAIWGQLQAVAAPQPAATPTSTSPAEEADPVLRALGHDPLDFDTLQARCGWDTAALQAHLLALELDGVVARLPGGRLQRVARA